MEIGLAVGGAFLNVLFDRLAPEGDLLKMFQKRKNDVQLLNKLKSTLRGLQAVLSDAENKQASDPSVSDWLKELRNAVDSAENLIEQFNYEALKLKVEGKHQNLAETSNQQVSDLNLCLRDGFFLKLEDTIKKLENLQKEISDLGLQKHFGSTKQETRTPSTSLVDESDIFGRQIEIEDLIDRLVSENANGQKLTVVPIVGMGGAGKTTLANVAYNDARVKNHFGLKAWFCVSEPYDAFRIMKGLLRGIGSFDPKDDGDLNQLQVKLKESLKGKKFLVVLDDVWNDTYSEWDSLRKVFVQGDMGSKIIVTTRKQSVAEMMCAKKVDLCAITVGILSSEDSWALFKRHSLENSHHPELEEVGKEIAVKCNGLPLALKTVAGTLRGKSEVDKWRNILRSEIWDQRCLNGILPELRLSYNDLPPDLKRCFAFCAIYPKDYEFCKDQVIYLWIANGLVKQFCLGEEYFDELRSRSLLERVPEFEWKSERFLMHDLINDLAQIASSKLCIRLEESKGSEYMLEQSRHMSYSMGREGDFEKLKQLSKSGLLRTLLPVNIFSGCQLSKRVLHNILPSLTSLRALSLSGYKIEEFPNDLFVKLKLLRFLDLSGTKIKRLPDSICALYNLETLLLSSCTDLEELLLQMEKLINLRHLDLSNTFNSKMLLHLSKLKSLQVLVGAKLRLGGLKMKDLGELENLYGSLSVLELENVVDKREALKAKLKEKNHVENLSLEWSEGSTAANSETERDILDELLPHTNIKEVKIIGYRGTKFSDWLADPSFLQLVELSLSNCKDCDSLPALGELPSLKFLSIRGMDRLTEVTEEFYGSSSSNKPFNSLEKLEFADMPDWNQWHVRGRGEFPKLEKLSIEKCPKLMGKLPENLSSLTELIISETPLFDEAQMLRSQFEGMKQIVKLSIAGCNSLASLPFSILPSTLKRIAICGCHKLKLKLEEPVGNCNMFLEELKLDECDSIDEFLPRARKLSISSCQNVTRFLIPTATESLCIFSCKNLEILSVAVESAMTSLDISYCEKLKCLPEIEHFNLQVLKIKFCEKLVNGRKEWCLHRLTELEIQHDGSDEEIQHWELPSSIKKLEVRNLKTLSSQVLKSLTSLQYLDIGNLPQIQSLLEDGGLPSSLSELHLYHHDELHSLHLCHLTSLLYLHLWNFPNLQSLSESTLPSSLSRLTIETFPNLQSLSESTLPSSLSKLTIQKCPKLQSLSELALPSSLSQLTIMLCPNLQSLPVKGMPSSLSELVISNCPLLTPLLEFDKGKYWPNIAHIPIIQIDWKCM